MMTQNSDTNRKLLEYNHCYDLYYIIFKNNLIILSILINIFSTIKYLNGQSIKLIVIGYK